jgi:diguanylate cyclase (GGDEF)-like protein
MTALTHDAATAPVARDPELQVHRPLAGERDADTGVALSHLSILLIDDEPMVTEVIQEFLNEAGHAHVVAVNQPEEAMDTARELRPALIMLDLMMPRVSGFEILEQLRRDAQLRYTPVIVLTASSNAATKLKALELGANEFLTKPVNESELAIRVRNSLALKVYQERLANFDPVTGLPKQPVVEQALERTLAWNQGSGRHVALLDVTLGGVHAVAGTYGQDVSDQLMGQVAERLKAASQRRADGSSQEPLVGRATSGGFLVVLDALHQAQEAGTAARRILDVLSEPFHIGEAEIPARPSVGIALFPEDGRSASLLHRNAASANEQARKVETIGFRYYCRDFDREMLESVRLEASLRHAIARGELAMALQPKVCVESGRIVGAEALLRWKHAELGWIPPLRFIPIAEQIGLMPEMGRWVVQRCCAILRRWGDTGLGHLSLSFNMSRQEMKVAGGVTPYIAKLMEHYRVPPGKLICEITESSLIESEETVRDQLARLREMGVPTSIDDFGSGFTSLGFVKELPADELKVDRSLVTPLPGRRADMAVLRAVVALGDSLGLRVVAEGVETPAQAGALIELGVSQLQGYMLGKPMGLDPFETLARSFALEPLLAPPLGTTPGA